MSVSKNASKMTTHYATLVSHLKRVINGRSESSFTMQQMKKTTTISSLAFLFMISGMVHLSAQDIGDRTSIKTKEGNIIYGTLITSNDSIVSIDTEELGLVSIPRSNITKMRPGILRLDGTYWFENPNPTRNLLSPTGIGLRKGEGNYRNTMLILQTVNYGLTDNFSIGGGLEIVSLILSDNRSPVLTASAKFSTASDKGLNTAAGVMFWHSSGDIGFNATILYSATTIGDRDNNFTAAIGFVKDEDGWGKKPVLAISAMGRVNKKFGLVTENWILPNQGNNVNDISFLFSVAGRYIAPSITVDTGIVLSNNLANFRLPWLGVTIPFGK